jgi:TolB protein
MEPKKVPGSIKTSFLANVGFIVLMLACFWSTATRAQKDASPHTGTIAYVRGGTEIRLINADGTNDRRLWTHPDAKKELGIYDVAWRPDGKELAFSSGHAAAYSLYHADLYAIHPDGTGFRKLTNSPDRAEFARYPKGSVSVTLRNEQPIYRQSQASSGVFIIYVAGADEPQQITLPPGSTKTIVFKNVADFGNVAQVVVAIWGKYRWFTPGVDVRAAQTVKAPVFGISGDGIDLFGAFRPVWRRDGSRVSYRSGVCTLNSASVTPTTGQYEFLPLFGGKNPMGTCVWDWGPTAATENQLLYSENSEGESGIFRITERGKHPGEKLTAYSNIPYQLLFDLRWLPDGSGFLFSNQTLMRDSANIFRYDFATGRTTQITRLQNEFTGMFSISPDGEWIVFERSKSLDDDRPIDLWIASIDGGNPRLLVRDGFSPSWH